MNRFKKIKTRVKNLTLSKAFPTTQNAYKTAQLSYKGLKVLIE
jgi:hypothetical protein